MKNSIFGSKLAKEVQFYFLHTFIVSTCYAKMKVIIVLVLILQFSLWTVMTALFLVITDLHRRKLHPWRRLWLPQANRKGKTEFHHQAPWQHQAPRQPEQRGRGRLHREYGRISTGQPSKTHREIRYHMLFAKFIAKKCLSNCLVPPADFADNSW